MTPPTFKETIVTIFKQESTETLIIQNEEEALSTFEEANNIEVLYFDILEVLDSTVTEIKQGTILLIDLIRNREKFHQVAKKIGDFETKEKQDVIDLEENTEWHERSKFVRFFVSSDKGNQLDQEKEEAKRAKSIVNQFAGKLTNFESFMDEYILNVGAAADPNFSLLFEEWKTLGKLKDSLLSARKHIRKGESKLKTRVSCGDSSCRVDNSRSKKHFSLAMSQLDKQIEIFKPIYEELAEQVEAKILQVRNKLLLK